MRNLTPAELAEADSAPPAPASAQRMRDLTPAELAEAGGAAKPAAPAATPHGRAGRFISSALTTMSQGATPYEEEINAAVTGAGNYLGDLAASKIHGLASGGKPVDFYRAERDARRAEVAAADKASPMGGAFGRGIGMALVAPLAGAASAATKVSPVVSAMLSGGSAAAGASEADLTRGEIVPLAKDIATGAALGGTVAAVPMAAKQYLSGAKERVTDRDVSALLGGTQKAKRDKALTTLKRNVGEEMDAATWAALPDEDKRSLMIKDALEDMGGRGAVKTVAKQEGINLREHPQIQPQIIAEKRNAIGEAIGQGYEEAGALTPGVDLNRLRDKLIESEKRAGGWHTPRRRARGRTAAPGKHVCTRRGNIRCRATPRPVEKSTGNADQGLPHGGQGLFQPNRQRETRS